MDRAETFASAKKQKAELADDAMIAREQLSTAAPHPPQSVVSYS